MKYDPDDNCEVEHKNKVQHNYWSCPTPYCSAIEYYCPDCKMYLVECGCGFESGMFSNSFIERQNDFYKDLMLIKEKS
ncbi:hypothetical protein M0R19_05925 [Candidatus Pacearchaeota archaeon]|jgi:hypothetical protein|nr:hypothetical protein [Candidatus Pacearchaeota archaeon]